jgi:hypothetical protein
MEPEDMATMDVELTPTVAGQLDRLADMVLAELDRLGAGYRLSDDP